MRVNVLQSVEGYLERAGLTGLDASRIQEQIDVLLKGAAKLAVEPNESLFSYRIPRMSPDGSCSIVDQLDETPYNLTGVLGDMTPESLEFVSALYSLVKSTDREVGADWLGIYKTFDNKLVKLAYKGIESRAEFPLTKEFAKKSNNSTVGLTGKAVVIQSVRKQVEEGHPYYECDSAVQSEACLPVYSPDLQEIIGIIDAESRHEGFFTKERLETLAALCIGLSTILSENSRN